MGKGNKMNKKLLNKKRNKIFLIVLIFFVLAFTPLLIYSNYHIEVENITFKNKDIPEAFNGTRIAHLSDYHNHGGKYDDRLVRVVADSEPDYIFITGDMVDRSFTNTDKTNSFLKKISSIAPCYLVWGNHEMEIEASELEKIKSCAKSCGISILNDDFTRLYKDNEYISVTGNYNYIEAVTGYGKDEFNIWLHHFPEDFEMIADSTGKSGHQMDLMFSGHAHGGLIGLPFVGGLIAPGQGIFPEYISGIYEYNGSSMIVSRGVGNSSTTLRLFNPFHVVICTLESSVKSYS